VFGFKSRDGNTLVRRLGDFILAGRDKLILMNPSPIKGGGYTRFCQVIKRDFLSGG